MARLHSNTPEGGLTSREKMWAAMRDMREFTIQELCVRTKMPLTRARDYIVGLVRAGILGATPGKHRGDFDVYHLEKDMGVNAPRVRRDGSFVPESGRTRMWKAMRILGTFSVRNLAGISSLEGAPVDVFASADQETMDVVQMVLTGKLNKEIVKLLLQGGGSAVGLSGVDSGLMRAKKMRREGVDLGFVGEVVEVNPGILVSLLEQGFIPVVSTVAVGQADDPSCYNINADTAAAKIAVALRAEKFVQMTNVPGVLRDINNPDSLIKRIAREAVPSMIATGIISSGMIPKIECCLEALKGGVPRTHIIDGRVPHSLLIEMFSDRGIGTMIV